MWVRAQGLSPDAPYIPENVSDPVGIHLNPPCRVKAWGDGPLKLKVYQETRHTLLVPCR